jgi:hypothetical protein
VVANPYGGEAEPDELHERPQDVARHPRVKAHLQCTQVTKGKKGQNLIISNPIGQYIESNPFVKTANALFRVNNQCTCCITKCWMRALKFRSLGSLKS